MGKTVAIIDIIRASGSGGSIDTPSIMGYSFSPVAADLTDDQLVTKAIAESFVVGVPTIEIPVIPTGTAIPFFIDVTLFTGLSATSDVITKATSYDPTTGVATGRLQRWYDILIEDQDTNNDGTGDFTGWNIYGHDDGSGNFKEDTHVIIKG